MAIDIDSFVADLGELSLDADEQMQEDGGDTLDHVSKLQKVEDALIDPDVTTNKGKGVVVVESGMEEYLAPNLSAIVGSAVAAELMDAAGGLSSLANMPACDVRLLGVKRENFFKGYIEQTEISQSTPLSFRMQACRLLAVKSVLAARMDSSRGDPTGEFGRYLREQILKKIEKSPIAKQPRLLPISNPRKKRVGRRSRLRYNSSKLRKLVSYMLLFESSLGEGFACIKISSGAATSGLTSTLAVQGIERSNPANKLGSSKI